MWHISNRGTGLARRKLQVKEGLWSTRLNERHGLDSLCKVLVYSDFES